MGNRLHLIIMHEYECCSACPWKILQFTVTGWVRGADVNIFCTSSWNMTAIQTTYSNLQQKRQVWNRVTNGSHLALLSVVLQKQHKRDKKTKEIWKRRYSAEQCQVEDYRWLALCRGAWACFQAHFSVIFSLYPLARSPWRVRMRHGAMWWMERG